MVCVAPEVALLVMVTLPVDVVAVVGSNCRLRVAVCPGVRVSGVLTPEALKPVPLRASPLMVTGAVPEEVRVTGWVAGVLSWTVPNAILLVLTVSAGTDGLSCREADLDMPLALAVRVAVCVVVTADALAEKPAVVAPQGRLCWPEC